MIKALCELVDMQDKYINFVITHDKVCGWIIQAHERIAIGEQNKLFEVQDCDLNRACADAYLKLTYWLCKNKGGYY